jgi:hypothetical protein
MGIKTPRQPGKETTDAENESPVSRDVYPGAGRQGVILRDGFEGLADVRAVDAIEKKKNDDHQDQDKIEIRQPGGETNAEAS